jgi:alkylation response protein AidB-like acyl-CoA dehydrogenase
MGEGLFRAVLERVDAIEPIVRDCASESERLGVLAAPVVAALEDAELFRILAPREFGGAGLTLPESVAVFERLAAFDAATAWTLAIVADGQLFARFLPQETGDALFRDADRRTAGTLNPVTARAERVDGGYRFSGRATYLSGSAHSNWMMAAAIVTEGGEPVVTDRGLHIRTGMFPIEQATRLDTWHVTGMRATGSTDYEFDDVMVDDDWTFAPLEPRDREGTDPFFSIPLWSVLGPGLAAVAVGAAHNMLQRFVELAATKVPTGGNVSRIAERGTAQVAVGEAQGLALAAHAVLAETADEIWSMGEARVPFDRDVLARHRLGVVTAVALSARSIDRLHDAAGMNAVASDSVLDRCWRDVHTITQHVILTPARYEVAGRVLMGLEPGMPVI